MILETSAAITVIGAGLIFLGNRFDNICMTSFGIVAITAAIIFGYGILGLLYPENTTKSVIDHFETAIFPDRICVTINSQDNAICFKDHFTYANYKELKLTKIDQLNSYGFQISNSYQFMEN